MKAIIFDWGRTIYDKDNGILFPETIEVLEYCSKKYRLTIISIASDGDIEGRFQKLDQLGIRKYFEIVLFHATDKESLARNVLGHMQLPSSEIVAVDDRIKRMGWAIERNCTTIWIQKGKFAHELPDKITGKPTHQVASLREIMTLL